MIDSKYLLTGAIEGTCVKTTAFGSAPEFILAYEGHHFDRHWNIHKTAEWEPNDPKWESLGIRLPTLTDVTLRQVGLYWVGIPPRKVEEFDMAWMEWSHVDPKTGKATNERIIRPRKEKTRFFFVKKFGYAFPVDGLETRVGFKVNARFTVFIEGVNPWIATVENDDWFIRFEGLIRRRCKNFFGAKSFYQLLSEEPAAQELLKKYHPIQRYLDEKHRDRVDTESDPIPVSFSQYMMAMRIKKKESGEIELADAGLTLSEILGVRIVDATFEDMDLDKDDPLGQKLSAVDIQEIENVKELGKAENEKEILKTIAEGEAAAMDLITKAKIERFKAHKLYEDNPAAATIALAEANTDIAEKYAEALKKNGNLQSVVLPNSQVQPVFPVTGGKN